MRYSGLSEKAIRRCFSTSLCDAIKRDYGKDEEAATLQNNILTKKRMGTYICEHRDCWPNQHVASTIWYEDERCNLRYRTWTDMKKHPKVIAKMRPKNRVYGQRDTYSKKINAA